MIYRREIDGLRALAVLPVILFHAGFQTFSGGYAGVDVFFVISGYLITSILLADLQAGKFSLISFYERRARRILPALFVMMLACLPFAWMWLMPAELKDFSESLAAVVTFLSNILFRNESGYFETATELKPLLHTWSLAVEEQYYLFFPPLLMLCWRLGKRWMMALLGVIALASLAQAHWDSAYHPDTAFYVLTTRGWELIIGALIAFRSADDERREPLHPLAGQALSLLGLMLIAYAVLVFDSATPFPSLYTLVPTIGAGLILYFATGQTLAGKLLASAPFVGIGLISYSAYLWHQPLFAFARHRSLNEPGRPLLAGLALASLVLAYLSWRFVETPFRDRKRIGTAKIFTLGALGSAVFIAAGLVGHVQDGFPGRFDSQLSSAFAPEKSTLEKQCKPTPIAEEPLLGKCEFGDPNGKTVFFLYGDSHAKALYSELDKALKQKGVKGIYISNEICLIPGIYDSRSKAGLAECERVTSYLYKFLATNVDYVAVGLRWTYRLYPIPGEIDSLLYDNGEDGVERGDPPRQNYTLDDGQRSTAGDEKKRAIDAFLGRVAATSKQMFLIYPVPEPGWNVPRRNFHSYIADDKVEDTISTSFDAYKKRNQFVDTVLDGFGDRGNLTRVRPSDILCNTYLPGRCVVQTGHVPLYHDDDHLSNAGARLVIAGMMSAVRGDAGRSGKAGVSGVALGDAPNRPKKSVQQAHRPAGKDAGVHRL